MIYVYVFLSIPYGTVIEGVLLYCHKGVLSEGTIAEVACTAVLEAEVNYPNKLWCSGWAISRRELVVGSWYAALLLLWSGVGR